MSISGTTSSTLSFAPGTYLENASVKEAEFCLTVGDPTYPIYFTSFTDIDRQTELNDDDGTLTGLTNKSTLPATPKPGRHHLRQSGGLLQRADRDGGMPVEYRGHAGQGLPAAEDDHADDREDQPL